MSYTPTPKTDFKPTLAEVRERVEAYRHGITPQQAEWMLIREHALNLPPTLPRRSITSAEFIARIPVATWEKVTAARAAGTAEAAALDQGLCRLVAGATVDAADADLLAALAGLVAAGVLTAEEKAQILDF